MARTEGRVRFVKGHSPREQSERILKMLGDGIRSGVGGSVNFVPKLNVLVTFHLRVCL